MNYEKGSRAGSFFCYAAVYADRALENLPKAIISQVSPQTIEASYRAEANYGDRILSLSCYEADKQQSLYQLLRESDGKELARIRADWREAV
jgi:acyl-ACP thioesterase